MHQRRKLSYLLFAYIVSEDLIRGNEVLQCVVRPVSQMLLASCNMGFPGLLL